MWEKKSNRSILLLAAIALMAASCSTSGKANYKRKCDGKRAILTPMGPM